MKEEGMKNKWYMMMKEGMRCVKEEEMKDENDKGTKHEGWYEMIFIISGGYDKEMTDGGMKNERSKGNRDEPWENTKDERSSEGRDHGR